MFAFFLLTTSFTTFLLGMVLGLFVKKKEKINQTVIVKSGNVYAIRKSNAQSKNYPYLYFDLRPGTSEWRPYDSCWANNCWGSFKQVKEIFELMPHGKEKVIHE
jgi:hypothetical protein